jgi:hypothetical protein
MRCGKAHLGGRRDARLADRLEGDAIRALPRDQYDEKVRSVIAHDTIGPVSVELARFRSLKR